MPWGSDPDLVSGAPFTPTKFDSGTWRSLEVRVTPAAVSATMDGVTVGVATADQIRAAVNANLNMVRKRSPHPCWDWCDPSHNPRGGLGLVVRQGVALFRDAVVEPLNP